MALLVLLGAGVAEAAFTPVPFEVAKALKVTRGKPIPTGIVFVNGKYIEPPYTVERYGNVIRINKIQVTGEVIPWSEFLTTQKTTQVAPDPSAAAAAPVEAAPAPEPAPTASDADDPLADLFDDTPKPASSAAKKPAYTFHAAPKPAAPSAKLDGPFVPDDHSKALVLKINATRQEIDAALRRGGFFFFGSAYSRVSGDSGTARELLRRLPAVMQQNSSYEGFRAAARNAGFVYFPDPLFAELFRNRTDYFRLQQRYQKMEEDSKFNSMLEGL